MSIDWFTVAAQVVNFLVLVWLLKRLLYKPILAAIDARETCIATELADAKKKQAEGQGVRDEFEGKAREFELQKAELLTLATKRASAEQKRMFDETKTGAEGLRQRLQEAVESDARGILQTIGQRVQREVFAATRKVLRDLASVGLEERVCEVFLRRLSELDGQEKLRLCTALRSSDEPAVVRSAFELAPARRAALQTALGEIVSGAAVIRFECSLELVFGIELTTNGEKIAWSVADYLTGLEDDVMRLARPSVKLGAATPPRRARAAHVVQEEPHA